MNLTAPQLQQLNTLLKNKNIDVPEFRRVVSPTGNNYTWLQRNILIRNPSINNELRVLLGMKPIKVEEPEAEVPGDNPGQGTDLQAA